VLSTVAAKAIGSTLGSSLAVVFNSRDSNPLLMVKRFIIGAILGFIFAPIVIDHLGWKHEMDYWIASATLCGVLGYLSLQIVFSDKMLARIFK